MKNEGTAGLQLEVGMCLSEVEELVPGCSSRGTSLMEEKGLMGRRRRVRTSECSCLLHVCWFPGTPAMTCSCCLSSGAARQCCCLCEEDSKRQVLERGDGLTPAVRVQKTVQNQGNTGGHCVRPDLHSSSSCWGWDSPLQVGVTAGVVMVKECVG